jgi:hypothetical protein
VNQSNGGESQGWQFGRRIEADRSWTVDYVFTGVPARQDGHNMTGLSPSDATDGMLTLNRCKDGRPRDRSTPTTRKRIAPSTREN